MDTNVEEILNLENTKFYMVLAEPVVDCLTTAIRHKQLSALSAFIWITLKSEVHLRSPEQWLTQKSIRELADKFGKSKGTIIKCLNELEQGGYILRSRARVDSYTNETSQISVRFPKKGIELADTYPNRRTIDSKLELNTLSTEVGQKMDHPWSKKQTVLKNTRNKKLENNKATELSTTSKTSVSDGTLPVKNICCLAAPNDNNEKTKDCGDKAEHDPLVEQIVSLEEKLEKVRADEKALTAKRQKDVRDTESFHKWKLAKSQLDSLEIQLESLKSVKAKPKHDKQGLPKTISNSSKGMKRGEAVTLPTKVTTKIERKIKELSVNKLITNPKELEAQIKYQVSNFEMGQSLEHAANICFKLVKNNTFRVPGGFAGQ